MIRLAKSNKPLASGQSWAQQPVAMLRAKAQASVVDGRRRELRRIAFKIQLTRVAGVIAIAYAVYCVAKFWPF